MKCSMLHSRLVLVTLVVLNTASDALVLLSDLPTPCLVLDISLLQRHCAALPPLEFPSDSDGTILLLVPHDPVSHLDIDATAPPVALVRDVAYVHTTVTRGKQPGDDPSTSFLAQLDSPPHIQDVTQLVLGLNNHHVGSYYWARSAGAGAAMEAPGVMVSETSCLQWKSNEGFIECNSNDGKRSEWVNFLQKGDTVQLLLLLQKPEQISDKETSILKKLPIFGVSSKGRPMGSEPEVVCKWKWQQ
jgi:hypothetical protein